MSLDGITCPQCGNTGRAVVESRRMPDRVRRRCACASCGVRFTTWELRSDQVSSSVQQLAAERAARLLERVRGLERSICGLHQLLEAEVEAGVDCCVDLPALSSRTCRQCAHWSSDRCDLGHPDPLEEGIGFARWCVSFQGAT